MSQSKVPAWFIVVLVILMLPLALWPFVMSWVSGRYDEATGQWLLMAFFPVYAILTCWLSYRCYTDRPTVSYVLLGVLLLSYLSLIL
ncbi:MAG: hypothetical protein NC117_09050 [Pseudoflavonifractor sp.]|nr:hypothetical protein [Pseudoflavonifractor sp.]